MTVQPACDVQVPGDVQREAFLLGLARCHGRVAVGHVPVHHPPGLLRTRPRSDAQSQAGPGVPDLEGLPAADWV